MALVLVVPVIASAQEASVRTPAASSTVKQTAAERLAARRAQARTHADQLFARINQMINQLSGLLARVQSRIAKMESESVDVTKAKAAATAAGTALDHAKTSLTDFRSRVEEAASSTKPVQAFQPIRTELKVVIQDLKQAHQKIVEAIRNLKTSTTTVTQ